MPLYDLVCSTCGNSIKDHYAHGYDDIPVCCDKAMTKRVGKINPGFPKHGITLTNVEHNPVHFETKSQMQKYARDNNVELGALL